MKQEITVRVNRTSGIIKMLATDDNGMPRCFTLDKVPSLIERLTEAVALVESYEEDTKDLKV